MLPSGIGFSEVLLILVVVLLVVGPSRLPDLARSLGKGMRAVRRAGRDLRDAIDTDDLRQQVYQPIRQWQREQDEADAELLAEEAREHEAARAKKAAAKARPAAAQPAAPALPAPAPEVPSGPAAAPDAEADDDHDEEGPAIVARDPGRACAPWPRPRGGEAG
ncbi:MAG: twin-arginine translocase TatA/TatE family subunit [bacterium]